MIYRGTPLHFRRIRKEFARRFHRAFEHIGRHAMIADVEKADACACVADRAERLRRAQGVTRPGDQDYVSDGARYAVALQRDEPRGACSECDRVLNLSRSALLGDCAVV